MKDKKPHRSPQGALRQMIQKENYRIFLLS